MMIRFSILAGVSSDVQAREDKASIDNQIATCRKAIEQLGGYEVALYIMDGFSRTGYDSLADAMADIPPLKEAIEAAEAGAYDVLILDNYDRLGDLGQLVNTRFRRYKKQLYSARQSGRVHDPASYDPSSDESSDIAMHVEGILQRYRLNKLRRGQIIGVQKRVEDGKHSLGFPSGYKKAESGLVLDEPIASIIVQMKDAFLAGKNLREIKDMANATGITPRKSDHWRRSTIRGILLNPFYAGKVFNARWKTASYKKRTPTGKRSTIMKLNPNAQLYDGKHPALWTWEEHIRIVEEMHERYKKHARYNMRNFSGLLICGICGKGMLYKLGKYRCYHHILLSEADANNMIGIALADALRNFSAAEPKRAVEATTEAAIAELEKQIARVQKGFREEIYTATQAKAEIDNLRAQIGAIEKSREDKELRAASRARVVAMRDELLPDLDLFPMMFADDQRRIRNNRMLRDVLVAIHVSPDLQFTFDFR